MTSGATAQRPGMFPQEAGTATYPVPLHTRLAGRARFKNRALYRANGLQTAVETRLRAVAGVQNVTVNPLTGTLLVEFDPALPLAALLPTLNAALAELPLPPLRPSSRWCEPTPSEPSAAVASPVASTTALRPAPTATEPAPPWHALAIEEVSARLESGTEGLSTAVARERLAHLGANVLPIAGRRSDLSILLEQLMTPPVAMLSLSAAVSIATGGLVDAAVIGAVVVLNALIGFSTERQSETIIATLTPTTAPDSRVLRDGHWQPVAPAALVPGDVLMLTPGSPVGRAQDVPDMRLLRTEGP